MIYERYRRRGLKVMMATALLNLTCILGTASQARAQVPAQSSGSFGKHLYKEHCARCHKWDGSGGGGDGGAAPALRAPQHHEDQIVNFVSCGVTGSGMPYHLRNSFTKAHPCYGSTSRKSFGKNAPLKPTDFLRPAEVSQVVKYVMRNIKGRGEATYAECRAFFGTHTRACDDYPKVADKHAAKSAAQ